MAYEHRIPDDLEPSGDIVVPLSIPHHPQYVSLLLYALRTLEEIDRYERDPDFDNEDAKTVAGQWRDRTITPLIDALAGATSMIKNSLGAIVLGANQTRANAAFADVTGSSYVHAFTKPKAKISLSNVACTLANTLNTGKLRIGLNVGGVMVQPETIVPAQTRALYRVSVVFGNIPAGNGTIVLQFASAGATTLTIEAAFPFLLEIEEYD